MKPLKIDWAFIHLLEGSRLRGYVPKEEDGPNNKVVSGVTVGAGFDLGQHSQKYLYDIQLTKALVTKLHPYMGMQGDHAKTFLKALPLTLTKKEAIELNTKVKQREARKVENLYNRDSGFMFYTLTREQQTVIMSVAFQYGDLSRKTPTFWSHVIRRHWDKAIKELENFGDSYPTRRRKEAKKLKGEL